MLSHVSRSISHRACEKAQEYANLYLYFYPHVDYLQMHLVSSSLGLETRRR